MIRLDLWLALTTGKRLRTAERVFGDADRLRSAAGHRRTERTSAAVGSDATDAVARFADIAAGYNLPESEIYRFAQDIARRCRTLG